MNNNYLPLLIQILLTTGFACTVLLASRIFGKKGENNPIKDAPYECGLRSEGQQQVSFNVKFYLVAALFILFDIEIVFLIPWAVVYREFLAAHLPILSTGMLFLALLTLGLCYELKKGALRWKP